MCIVQGMFVFVRGFFLSFGWCCLFNPVKPAVCSLCQVQMELAHVRRFCIPLFVACSFFFSSFLLSSLQISTSTTPLLHHTHNLCNKIHLLTRLGEERTREGGRGCVAPSWEHGRGEEAGGFRIAEHDVEILHSLARGTL